MSKKQKASGRKPSKKAASKSSKPGKPVKASPKAKLVKLREPIPPASVKVEPPTHSVESVRETPISMIIIERIEGETVLGDLMVVFPRTREVLKKYGLNLDVEEAGDIYMSLGAFAALRGLEMGALIQELETASKDLPPPPPAPAMVVAPAP